MGKYSPETKDNKCIFCEIANKNLDPTGRGTIWEDENFMAWLSPFPNTLGATVVIPKEHYSSDVLKMPDIDLNNLILAAKKVSKILENYFEDVGRVGLIMEGTGIDHAHVKLFPMHDTDHMKEGNWKQILSNVNTYFETYQGYISSHCGPQADLKELEKLAKEIQNNSLI